MRKMRTALLALAALLAIGCAKEEPIGPTTLKSAEEVNKVVQKGMTMEEVKKAAGKPSGVFGTGAPNADTMWTYDVPVEKPEARVQVFFLNGKVVEKATIPFSTTPTSPTMGG
jgi:hypothetical protein